MTTMNDLFKKSFLQQISIEHVTPELALKILVAALLLGLYVLVVYVVVTRKSFYSVSFGKTLLGLTVITSAIILAMQASIVVSLGMVGALSIVRFRNAVKDPLDLLFLFWSISIGIICGTGLFYIAVLASLAMTVIVLGVDYLPIHRASYLLVLNGTRELTQPAASQTVKANCRSWKLRTSSVTAEGVELLYEVRPRRDAELVDVCMKLPGVTGATLLQHDGEVC